MTTRNVNPNNEDIHFGKGTIEVAGTTFRAADIQDVKVVAGPVPGTAKRRALLTSLILLLALIALSFNLAGVLPEELERLSHLFIAVVLLSVAAMPYRR
jgi:hypothetical protein